MEQTDRRGRVAALYRPRVIVIAKYVLDLGFYADASVFRIKHGAWVINVDNVSIAAAWIGSGGVGGLGVFLGKPKNISGGCLDWLGVSMTV